MLNFALASVSALLLIALFPPFDAAFLSPFALAPLLAASARQRGTRRRFLMGWSAGFIYWFGVCTWIQFVLAEHGGMGQTGGWAVFFLFCAGKAMHLAAFTALAGPLMRHWYAIPAVAALWTGIERTHGPLAFAWLTLGNAGIDMGVPMRLAPVVGVYGLSFVFAMMSAAVALLALKRQRLQLAWLLALPMLYLLPALPGAERATHSAVAVQPNVPMGTYWNPNDAKKLHDELMTLSLRSALDGKLAKPSFIVWPESPGPFYYYNDPLFRERVTGLTRASGLPMLFGTVAYTTEHAPLNSAVLVGANGDLASRYDKMFLVPFGEFVPPLFSFVNRITQETGDFVPGDRVVVSQVGQRGIGAFICYESAFPHLVREFPRAGAELLVNLTNDGYFGRSSARAQHLLLARMRAAENRRWLLRPTNDGYTVSIDPAGRVIDRVEPYQRAAARLSFSYVEQTTAYTRFGDWFAWLCLASSLPLAAALSWKNASQR